MKFIKRIFLSLVRFFKYHKQNDILRQYYEEIDKSIGVTHGDLKGYITYANQTFLDMSGYTKEELIGKPHNILRFRGASKEMFKDMWKTIKAGNTWNSLMPMVTNDSDILIFDVTIVPIVNPLGKIIKYVSIRTNVTEISKLECDLHNTQASIIKSLGDLAESNSKETAGHVVRVASYTKLLATIYGMDGPEVEILALASQLHDIGKISTPPHILGKPGRLTDEEMVIMKEHSNYGYELLKGAELPILQAAAAISRDHHENWDGSGYPNGIEGTDIHLYGRIVALADVLDALCMKRVYKDAWSEDEAFKFILEQKGVKFDPKLVNLLMNNIETFKKIKNRQMEYQSMEIPDMKTIESMCNVDHPDVNKLDLTSNTKQQTLRKNNGLEFKR
jgi:PAS domain S-box-containing protein